MFTSEDGHATADEQGFRRDVLDLVNELGVTMVRYPGGNFVSAYHWEDGVGPRSERPTRLDLAWHTIESNEIGTDEFIDWARLASVEPMFAVNLGTRGIDAARNLLEYCNFPGGTQLSDARVMNGHAEPHAIPIWCLGNEMDGPWQTGQKTAREYGRLAREAGKAMKQLDPSIELVACGSSSRSMPTFASWEAEVLEECYDVADYISLHAYYEQDGEDLGSFLASSYDMNAFIESVVATCDHVRARVRSDRRINLSFDEWNVWYQSRLGDLTKLDWEHHPALIENQYTLVDAVVFGTLLITLLRNADRVRVACLAQLINAIAPIMTEPGGPAWRQTIFYPFALTAAHAATGVVLRVEPTSPTLDTARFGQVAALEATAVWHESRGELAIFAVNRSITEPLELEVALRDFDDLTVGEHTALADPDASAVNTKEQPNRIQPLMLDRPRLDGGIVRATLPPMSWNLVRLTGAQQ